MAFFEYFPFDHAVQIRYNANDEEISRETKTSGNVYFGYERNYSQYPVGYGTKVPHYACELWFRIPSDAYKYWYFSRFFWYRDFGVSAEADYVQYKYWENYATTPTSRGVDVITGKDNLNSTSSVCEAKIMPGDRRISGYEYSYLRLSEADINYVQVNGSEYIKILCRPMSYGLKQSGDHYFYETTQMDTLSLDNLNFGTDAVNILINIDPVYPVNVYARNDADLTVDWLFSNDKNRSQTYFYPAASNITITDSDGNSITYQIVGDDTEHVFTVEDLEALEIGQCTITVDVLTNYGTTGQAVFVFELTGISDAPEITSVTQNSYPTISWDANDQICWEMQISDGRGIIYKTGMVSGSDQEFTVPKLLEDGGYSIEMRILNIYGILSAWGSYFLDLHPTKPSAPDGVVVSARPDFGISIHCDEFETTGKLLAVRRKDAESTPVVLGEYNGSFIDYFVGLNDPHEYTVRNYVEGYSDGEWIDGTSIAPGVVIRDADNYTKFIHIWMSESQTTEYQKSEERSDVLMQCIGRKYPVAELGEWVTSTRSFKGYITNDDFDKLIDMKLNSSHVLMQANEEYLPCYMEFSDQGEYVNDGRIVRFQMTRIDGEK